MSWPTHPPFSHAFNEPFGWFYRLDKLNFSRSVHTLGDLEGRVSGLDFAATQTKSQAEVVRSYLGVPAKSENVHDNAAKWFTKPTEYQNQTVGPKGGLSAVFVLKFMTGAINPYAHRPTHVWMMHVGKYQAQETGGRFFKIPFLGHLANISYKNGFAK